jgi:methylglutaconyl-CoA hydratase
MPIDEEIAGETARLIAEIRATPEAQEGLSAFLQKRTPSWTARAGKPAKKATTKRAKPRR